MSLEFKSDTPIYRQIVEYAYARILSGEWPSGERVPSVRELAASMAVNSHTVLKAYDYLEAHGVIAPRRGMGFFTAPDARERVDADRRENFFDTTLREVFAQMKMLGVGIEDVVEHYRKYENPDKS